MGSKENRRRYQRYSASDVRGQFSYSVEANVLNISLGGLSVRTHTQLNIGRKYRFRLGNDRHAVQLTGLVRWCRMSGTEKLDTGDIVPVYEAGISFDDVLTERAEELLGFMERSVIVDLKRRISGRFKVRSQNSVQLESDSSFLVKQISIAGMMIEADVALKPDTSLDLEMRLGRRKFTSSARIVYLAEVNLQDEALRYLLGVEFVRTPPEKREVLETFLRTELKKGSKPTKLKKGSKPTKSK